MPEMTRAQATVARPPAVLVPLIRAQIREAERVGEAHYRAVGEMLLEAQASVPRGEWGKWLKQNFAMHAGTAASYMRLVRGEATRVGKANVAGWYREVQQHVRHVDVRRLRSEALSAQREAGLVRGLAEEIVAIGFKVLATKLHPDRPGGSTEAMVRLNAARDLLKEAVK